MYLNMNKKLIRLTESDLHRIVRESVNNILKEIGDTPKGQYMLGRLAGRQSAKGDLNFIATDDYAEKQSNISPNKKNMRSFNDMGYKDERQYLNSLHPRNRHK